MYSYEYSIYIYQYIDKYKYDIYVSYYIFNYFLNLIYTDNANFF